MKKDIDDGVSKTEVDKDIERMLAMGCFGIGLCSRRIILDPNKEDNFRNNKKFE